MTWSLPFPTKYVHIKLILWVCNQFYLRSNKVRSNRFLGLPPTRGTQKHENSKEVNADSLDLLGALEAALLMELMKPLIGVLPGTSTVQHIRAHPGVPLRFPRDVTTCPWRYYLDAIPNRLTD